MNFFFEPHFFTIAISHFSVDFINSLRAIFVTYLSDSLHLSNTMIGLFTSLYVIISSLSQPFFGYVSDRIGARVVLTGGLIWLASFLGLAICFPGWTTLLFLLIGSLGSGAVHPAGTAQSTLIGRKKMAGHEATAYSLFSLSGQFGSFLGPILGGLLLDYFGMKGVGLVVLAVLPVIIMVFRIKDFIPAIQPKVASTLPRPSVKVISLIVILLIATSQAWAQQTISTFMPKYLKDAGWSATQYGLIASLFMGGSAVGVVFGGQLSDKIGRWQVICSGLCFSSIPFFLVPAAGFGFWLYAVVLSAGFLSGSTFACIVVLAQTLIPMGMGLASGLVMGFTFAMGAVGMLLSGWVADVYGFVPVFHIGSAMALFGGLLSLYFRNH